MHMVEKWKDWSDPGLSEFNCSKNGKILKEVIFSSAGLSQHHFDQANEILIKTCHWDAFRDITGPKYLITLRSCFILVNVIILYVCLGVI